MTDGSLVDTFRELHKAELDQKQKLDSADTPLLAMLTAMYGAGAYFLKNLPMGEISKLSDGVLIASLVLTILFFSSCIGATFCVIGSFWPRRKAYVASALQLRKHMDDLETFHKTYHKDKALAARVFSDFVEVLERQFIKASETNRELNVNKTFWQAWTKRYLAVAVVLLLLNALPIYYLQSARPNSNSLTQNPIDGSNNIGGQK